MMNKIFAGCGVGLFTLLTVLPVHAQEGATLVLLDGQRPSGELIDLNAGGFTLRTNGQEQRGASISAPGPSRPGDDVQQRHDESGPDNRRHDGKGLAAQVERERL